MIEPKSSIKDIKPYINKKSIAKDPRLKLDENENVYGASSFAISALKNFNPDKARLYPKYDEYKDKFAKIFDVNLDNILFVPEADSAISLIIRTYIDNNDKLLCQNPVDEKILIYAKAEGARIEFFNFNDVFESDIEKIKEKLQDDIKLCYIASPDSISGYTIRSSCVSKLLEEFQNTLFVVDISYIAFSDEFSLKDYTDLIKNNSNIIVIKSYASDAALAGLGLGIVISDTRNIENLKTIAPKYAPSLVNMHCVLSSLNDKKYFEKINKENSEAKDLLSKGLSDLGYKPYKSDGNFILCDFGEHCEFYYNKLKNNGVIVKNFEKYSIVSNCLRITVPKVSGVKYILKLFEVRNLIVFAFEDTLFDVRKSFNEALIRAFEDYAKYRISIDSVKEAKRVLNCSFIEAVYRLLLDDYINVSLDDVQASFEAHFLNSSDTEPLINNDELLIEEELLEKLSLKYDMVLITDRKENEAIYSLEKNEIQKYFAYVKSDSLEISEIINKCPHKKIELIVANEEILSSAKKADIKSIGFIAGDNNNSIKINNLKHLGADKIIFENKSLLDYFEIDSQED